jgi:hypothetical protein
LDEDAKYNCTAAGQAGQFLDKRALHKGSIFSTILSHISSGSHAVFVLRLLSFVVVIIWRADLQRSGEARAEWDNRLGQGKRIGKSLAPRNADTRLRSSAGEIVRVSKQKIQQIQEAFVQVSCECCAGCCSNSHIMSLFYLCTQEKCNRKYKRKDKLVKHLLLDHEKIVAEEDIFAPEEITHENKKNKEQEKDSKVKAEKERLLREQIRIRQAEVEEDTRRIRDEFLVQNAEKIRKLEEDGFRLKQEQLQLDEDYINTCKRVQERKSNTDCAICYDRPANTATSPCGHACFCYECLLTYMHQHEKRGCPVCRGKIERLVQLFD